MSCSTAQMVIVSGRVRLARNYFDLPFSVQKKPENALTCVCRARDALSELAQSYTLYQMNSLKPLEQQMLVEQHLISRDLLKNPDSGAVLIRNDELVSVMINEEDHLRIQAMGSGESLNEIANEAFAAEEALEDICTFSYDPQLGYLTSCPTNTGTGMRASLMLHLPMLTRCKQMGNINQSIAKLGLTIRGIYGEGSEALGDLYQVSNQVTLGRTEEEIVDAVSAVGKKMIDMECALREHSQKEKSAELEDVIWRSYGLLSYAKQMDEKEFMLHWSNLRFGSSIDLLPITLQTADELLKLGQNAHAQNYGDSLEYPLPAEQARCEHIQKMLLGIR